MDRLSPTVCPSERVPDTVGKHPCHFPVYYRRGNDSQFGCVVCLSWRVSPIIGFPHVSHSRL